MAKEVDLITETTGKRIAKALEGGYELDGTASGYKAAMRQFFVNNDAANADPEKLTALVDEWYEMTRNDWCGWTEFYQPSVSAVTTGTKGGDNAGMTCTPSTDTEANQDDYAGNPLFACADCNWEVDPDTLQPVITAIDGISPDFERKNPDKYVGVLQMAGYVFNEEKTDTYIWGYAANSNVNRKNIFPLPDAVNPDGTVRSWVVHGKYMSKTVDNKMTCCAGNIPTAWLSHNTVHTQSQANGSQYSGATTADDFFLKLMAYIKYGSLTLDGILQGTCSPWSLQYYVMVPEDGTRRVILANSDAANMEVGMGVLIGSYTSGADRSTADSYSITGQAGAIVTAIEDYDEDNKAVYVDTDDTFNTVANGSAAEGTTVVFSFHWPTGTTDSVLGNDGSPTDPTVGKYPAKLQGIEYMNGCYEILADVILSMYQDESEYYYEPYIVRTASQQATSISGNYEAAGVRCKDEVTASTWGYIKKLGHGKGVLFPIELGGSSTTYTRDAFYQAAQNASATREWLARGGLTSGVASAGLSCLVGSNSLSASNWHYASRLSASGNRGEFVA